MNLLASNSAEDNRRWARSTQAAGASAVRPVPLQSSTQDEFASSPAAKLEQLDGPLYDVVLERLRKPGPTVRAEEVLGDLDGPDTNAD